MYSWLSQKAEPKFSDVAMVARRSGRGIDWLLGGGEGDIAVELKSSRQAHGVISSREDDRFLSIPRFDAVASAGSSAADPAVLEPAYFMQLDTDWLAKFVPPGVEISVLEARGDSMAPTLADGDLLLIRHDIDTARVLYGGGIFVLTFDGGLIVKRVDPGADRDMRLISDNPRYDTISIPRAEWDDRVIVHGQVFWSGGTITGR